MNRRLHRGVSLLGVSGLGVSALAAVSGLALLAASQTALADPPGQRACPPGLAKKNPACMPPGLYKKYHRGDIVPDWRSYERLRHRDYDLPPPGPGRHYIRIGRDAYLIAEGTQRVIEAINLFGAVGR